MVLHNVEDVYTVEDKITCSAEGNPDPDMIWLDDQNKTLSDYSVLEINESMAGLQTFICVATNVVREQVWMVSQHITAYVYVLGEDFTIAIAILGNSRFPFSALQCEKALRLKLI